MPTRRRPIRRPPRGRITAEAISAWHACDASALHQALRLSLWQPSPLPVEITALGIDADEDSAPDDVFAEDRKEWQRIKGLQRELLASLGWPSGCRAVYEEKLQKAIEWLDYCKSLVEHPGSGAKGTGANPEARQRQLVEAEEAVTWRRALLAELGDE